MGLPGDAAVAMTEIDELKTKIAGLVDNATGENEMSDVISALRVKLGELEKLVGNLERDRPDLSASELVALRRKSSDEIEATRIELGRIEKTRNGELATRANALRQAAAEVADILFALGAARQKEVQDTLNSFLPERERIDWTHPTVGTAGGLWCFIDRCTGVGERNELGKRLKNPVQTKTIEADIGNLSAYLKQAIQLI